MERNKCSHAFVEEIESTPQEQHNVNRKKSRTDKGCANANLDGDRVVAALSVGRSDDLEHARRLMVSGSDLGDRAGVLADASTDLGSI